MGAKMDEFLERFHSLGSNDLQDIKRHFNELIDDIGRDVPDLDTFVASIEPQTKLGSVLKVEILIRFKKYDALLEVLKSGNPMLIGKVLKFWELFEVVFSKIDAQTLVERIFPQTSVSTRTKIITRLSMNLKNEELADSYFRAIENKYGLFVAKGLLPACSLDLIKSTVSAYNLNLTNRQLLKIVKRNREFLGYYFDVLRQAHGDFYFSGKYEQVLKYMAKVDAQLFWGLFKKYQLNMKFGRHMTSRLYESGKEVLETSDDKLKLFNSRKLYKMLVKNEGGLRRFICELLPKKSNVSASEYFSYSLMTLIGYMPKAQRYEFLNACFENTYDKSIHEFLSVKTPEDILKIMPVKEREIIIDKKVSSNEDLIYMYSPKRALLLLQERIKLTSNIRQRSSLVVQLYKTCLLNQDSASLLEVLKYVRLRHRNDNIVLSDFMMSLQEWPHLEKLTGEHWTYINELFNICKRMSSYRLNHYDVNFLMRYVLYLEENQMPCEEFMETFLRHLKEHVGHIDVFYNRELPECQKMCYEHFARLLPKVYTGEEFERLSYSLLGLMVSYNRKYPKNKIAVFQYPPLRDAFKKEIAKENFYSNGELLKYYLKFEDDGDGDQLMWDNYEKVWSPDMIVWYLRERPNKIPERLDKILTSQLKQGIEYTLPQILNLASMLPPIGEKIVSFSLTALNDDELAKSKFAATSLSYLLPPEKYFEIARPFVPLSVGKIDPKLFKDNFVSTQEAVVNGLANLDNPVSCLPMLLEFCVGDYMKYASKSLYHVVNHTPESKLESFLDSLYNSAVSVRKHAVNISSWVSPKTTVYNFLKQAGLNDNHPSLRKAIFKSTLRYFTANPSAEFWSLLKEHIRIIDDNDRETLESLVCLQKIPDGYLPEYFLTAYTILANNKHRETQAKKFHLLTSVQKEKIDKLGAASLTAVIKDTFLCPDALQKSDFYLNCLFYTTGSNHERVLELVLGILKEYIEKNYVVRNSSPKTLAELYSIIYAVCLKAVTLKSGKDLIAKFIEFWMCNIAQGELHEEYLLLQLTKAYLCFEAEPREYGIKISEVLGQCVGSHGSSIVAMFVERVMDFLKGFSHVVDEKKLFEFIDGLLRASDADVNCILTIRLLFDRVPWDDIQVQYGPVLQRLREHESSAVQIYLRRRLRTVKV